MRVASLLACALLVTLAWASLGSPATLRTIDITRHSGRYSLLSETWLDAEPDDIFAVLLDYDHFSRISRVYKEHGYLEPDDDGTPIIYTRMEGCLIKRVFCKSMRRVERLETDRPHYMRTVTLPEQSDFKYSTSEWTLEEEGDGTRMTYRLVMEPDFWVPPILGPWYLKRTLESGGKAAINRIERLAQRVARDSDGV